MRVLLATLLVWLASVAIATAGWRLVSSHRENSPNELVEHREAVAENSASGARATLCIALFSFDTATIRVIDQPHEPRSDLATVMERTDALAGVNGGYFDPQDAPVGLLVSSGKKIASRSTAKLLSGVLWASATRVEIVRAKHFSMNGKTWDALQCGPLLVEQAKPVPGLNDTRAARRTFAAVDGHGHAAVGVSSSVSLADLGEILSLTNVSGSKKFVRALNLDGGSSSAFWIAGNSEMFEQKTVRDFVGIFPRAGR
ncbi:MAG TPA: phosphodiester glycosidase family protein [Chthoniobacterales bacterium]|jgi:uncharacterized protein YigE (DUF2233 family)